MMKIKWVIKSILLLTAFIGLVNTGFSQDTAWTEKKADKWFKSGEWKNGLHIEGHTSINKLEFARQYHKNKAEWDKAFAFIRDSDITHMKPGKYLIDGNDVYAMITEGPEKTFEQTAWESHRKYIDLHYVVTGKEKMGKAPIAGATVTQAYDEKADIAHYTTEGRFYTGDPGEFFLFFPSDAHRPGIKVDGFETVRKLVIKIRYVD